MHDLLQDWQRWTRAERVMAILITTLLIGVPMALGFHIYLATPSQSGGLGSLF
jgi:hypothetical protein